LGIYSLKELGWALRMRWLWLTKVEPDKPWAGLPMHFPSKVKSFFHAATHTEIGNGHSTLFWEDRWIHGRNVMDIAPRLLLAVPRRIQNSRTVQTALANRSWLNDIQGALTVEVLADYLDLWDAITTVNINPHREDKHIFRFAHNGKYSAKVAYESLFIGSTYFEHCDRVWHSWSPPKCKFFLWLVALQRCWTADRLQRRGLDHPDQCPLCDQEMETIDHLLVRCVFARNYWFKLLTKVNLQNFTPYVYEENTMIWWKRCSDQLHGIARKGLNSLISLGLWILWKHRNACVFDGLSPCLNEAIKRTEEERDLWVLGGATNLDLLTAPIPGL
jgi:hypothetical protein